MIASVPGPLPDRRDGGSLAKIAANEEDEVNGRSHRRLLLHRKTSHANPGEADFRNHSEPATPALALVGDLASASGPKAAMAATSRTIDDSTGAVPPSDAASPPLAVSIIEG